MGKSLSTRNTLVSLSAITLSLVACVDAQGEYDEFNDRLGPPAAAEEFRCTPEDPIVEIPDVTGDWLFAVRPKGLPEDKVNLFTGHIDLRTFTGNVGKVDMEAQALGLVSRKPVGEVFVANNRDVCTNATFSAPLVGELDGEASISGTPQPVDAVMIGTMKSADFVCGVMTGDVGPLPLEGTTWAAVRITDPTGPLPKFVYACPE